MIPLPFVTASTEPVSKPASAGTLINLFAEPNPQGAKYPYSLYVVPGRKSFATIGSGPIREAVQWHDHSGAADVEYWIIVSGREVYAVKSDGTASLLGEVATSGDVYMASSKSQVAIAAGGLGYIADISSLTQIADADFPASVETVTHLDGYFIWTVANSGTWHISALNDGTAYDALEFASNEAHWDNTVRAFANRREVWFFGEKTTEVWFNSGASFPFERISGAVLQKGSNSPKSIVEADNTVVWVGDDFQVHRANGYQPQRISTPAVEKDLRGVVGVVSFAYSQGGHSFYVMKIPGVTTWAYDFSTGLWHERKTQGSIVWEPEYAAEIWNKVMVAGGKTVTELDPMTYDEEGAEITWAATTAPIFNGTDIFSLPIIQMDMETGVGLTSGQGSDPQIRLRISTDGGRQWSSERWRSFGKIGEYEQRAIWYRNGRARTFTLEFSGSDPVPTALMGAYGGFA